MTTANGLDPAILRKQVFTTGDVANICKVAPRTVSKWFDAGRLRGYQIPGSHDRRIPRANLLAFLNEHGMPLHGLETSHLSGVLVVSPDASLATSLAAALPESDGFRHAAVGTGFDAGVILETFRPDVVVIDCLLGRGEALHILGRLRRCRPDVPVIVLASEDEGELASIESIHLASEAVRKPLGAGELAERVRTWARK